MTTKGNRSAREVLESMDGPLTVARVLSSYRYCEEVSQVDLARTLGISRSQLCDIEKGRHLVSPAMAAKFARILGESERLFVCLAIEDALRHDGMNCSVNVEFLDKARKAKPKAAKQARRPTPARERLAAAG